MKGEEIGLERGNLPPRIFVFHSFVPSFLYLCISVFTFVSSHSGFGSEVVVNRSKV